MQNESRVNGGETEPAHSSRLAWVAGALFAAWVVGLLAYFGIPRIGGGTSAASVQAAPGNRPQRQPAVAAGPAQPGASVAMGPAAGTDPAAGALGPYQAAVARRPNDAGAHNSLAQLLVRLNRVEEALPHFRRAIDLNPDRVAPRLNLARALERLLRLDEAVAAYRDVLRLSPDDAGATFGLGLALQTSGDDSAAVTELEKAIALDPANASIRLALGASLERLQRPREAANAYAEYVRLAPSAPDADEVRTRVARLESPASSR